MSQRKLSDAQKGQIAYAFINKLLDRSELAEKYQVSRRTIDRVLLEKEAVEACVRPTEQDREFLKILKSHVITPGQLEFLLRKNKVKINTKRQADYGYKATT